MSGTVNQARPSTVLRAVSILGWQVEMETRADAILGHFNRYYFHHPKAEPREGLKVGKDLRDLMVSQARR